jgi:D-alanine-D-alanine ligase
MSDTLLIRLGLLFGGRSEEHTVSVVSAHSVMQAIDRTKYQVFPLRISRSGRWELLPEESFGWDAKALEYGQGTPVGFAPLQPETPLWTGEGQAPVEVDVYFPLLHGVQGEDGTIQGLLALTETPFVGSGVMASAIGMDKIWMKKVFRQAGLEVVPSVGFSTHQWQVDRKALTDEIKETLGYPVFVKPSNTGSSIGISRVAEPERLSEAVDLAGRLDRKVIVEKAVDGRELECGVLGRAQPHASVVGEIETDRSFYDYEAKYADEGTRLIIPAEIEIPMAEEIRREAIRAFEAIDGAGLARVDFFLERKRNQLYVNEINTMPGFTPRSMFPLLWKTSGVPYPELIDQLVQMALEAAGSE